MIEEKEFQFDHRAAFPQGPGEGDFHSDASMCNKGEDTKKRNIVVEKVQFGVNASVCLGYRIGLRRGEYRKMVSLALQIVVDVYGNGGYADGRVILSFCSK